MDLEGAKAIVTGASRGVGRAIAEGLAAEGVTVACVARTTDVTAGKLPGTIDETVSAIREKGGSAFAVEANLADLGRVPEMVGTCLSVLGGVDIVVNNAAVSFAGDLDMPLRHYEIMERVNLLAPWLIMRETLPEMRARGSGSVLNMLSAAALFPFPRLTGYGMVKAALERLTIDAAYEFRESRVTVNGFRIDVPVDSEGIVYNRGGNRSAVAEPSTVAAEGAIWVLRQDPPFTGRLVGMAALREEQGIMHTEASEPYRGYVPEVMGLGPFLPA